MQKEIKIGELRFTGSSFGIGYELPPSTIIKIIKPCLSLPTSCLQSLPVTAPAAVVAGQMLGVSRPAVLYQLKAKPLRQEELIQWAHESLSGPQTRALLKGRSFHKRIGLKIARACATIGDSTSISEATFAQSAGDDE